MTGARQSGKTTLARALELEKSKHETLDRAILCKAAADDPAGFVEREPGETFIIDEVQKVPQLLDEIKIRVDENNERGQYLLTGSSNLRFAKAVRDSLAGRMRTIRLRTLTKSEYSRIGKRSKYFASDPSLPANLLGWKENEVYLDDDKSGKIVETWVYHELAALADFVGGYTISQYRDSEKREIDFIIENEAGAILGVEVKSGSSIGDSDFRHLRWFRENVFKGSFTGIVLHSGREAARFGEGMFAVPLGAVAL